MTWVRKLAEGLPQLLSVSDDPRVLDSFVSHAEEGYADVADAPTRRSDPGKLALVRPGPGQTCHCAVVGREKLVELVVPVGKRPAHSADVLAERSSPLADRAKRASKADALGEQLVDQVEAPVVPELIVEAAYEALVRRAHRHSVRWRWGLAVPGR